MEAEMHDFDGVAQQRILGVNLARAPQKRQQQNSTYMPSVSP
jgi:hypothetical protein